MARAIRILAGTALALGMLAFGAALLAFYRRVEPRTPLAHAAAGGDSAEVKALLDGGAPPESATESWSPLMWAARSGAPESVRTLIEAGADPNRRDGGPNGWTPLLHAVHKEQIGAVRALIAAGADVNRAAPNGLTPLLLAAAQGETEMVELLVDAGADPRVQSDGMTALHYALLSNEPQVVEALLHRSPGLRLGYGWRDWGVRKYAWLRGRSALLARVDGIRRGIR